MPSRILTRSAAAVAILLVTVAMVASCARADVSSGMPAPDGVPHLAAAADRSAAGTTESVTPAATPAAGSVISAPLPTLDTDEVALQSAMPGLFGAAELHPTVTGDVISVWSQHPCTALLDVLRAGQWSMDLVHQPSKKGQRTWAAVLRQGDARALLVLNGGAGGCQGRITRDRAVPVTASGAASADGDGRFLSFMCTAQWDGSSSGATPGSVATELTPSQVFLFGLYTVDDHAFLLVGQLPTALGTVKVTPAGLVGDGDADGTQPMFSMSLLPADQDPLEVLISSFGVLLYPLDLSAEQGDQGGDGFGALLNSYPAYASGRHTKETITVTATAPVSGTVTATGLVNQQHPSKATLDFFAPFTCDR